MASSYSQNLALELIGTGDQAGTWGVTTNTNLGTLIEQAISGYVTQAVSTGGDTTITIPNGATGVARNMYIELTGTGGASTNLIVPANKKLYFIFNNTASGQVTVKVSGQTGVSVPNKAKMILVSNGTDIVEATNFVGALSATSLTVSSGSTLNGGVVINEPGADADTRIEGDTDANLFFVDASTDAVGIGTNSPAAKLHIVSVNNEVFSFGANATWNYGVWRHQSSGDLAYIGEGGGGAVSGGAATDFAIRAQQGGLLFATNGNNIRATLDSSGNLGLGVTPSASSVKTFEIGNVGNTLSGFGGGDIALMSGVYYDSPNFKYAVSTIPVSSYRQQDGVHKWNIAASGTAGNNITFTQAMTLDASGRLGVGTTSPSSFGVTAERGSSDSVYFTANNTSGYNFIAGVAPALGYGLLGMTTNHALVFITNNAEKARITSGGDLLVGKTTDDYNTAGATIYSYGLGQFTRSAGTPLNVNRKTNDGTLVAFFRDANSEGSISVSGSTVSYNAFAGSHWSQLQDGSKPDILRGTVMESINELCVWPGEENERLPKSKISDTAGSKKVYGVFMAWDNDWTETNDMYVTAVGAFICRVNGAVTVQEGDLLESNGDGTARVQADDIIRSSTIGKVTSTVKTHEYDDGSYCVPTVLYCG